MWARGWRQNATVFRRRSALRNDSTRALSHSTQAQGPFRLAVVGSGPAGFYGAHRVMQRMQDVAIDMYEQLPVPFGLVRFGVAPDHPEVKNCEDKFTQVATSPNFNFFGNVQIGKDVTLEMLRANYDAILFAYGASKDRTLGVLGEDLKHVYSARAFVGWYNGLPEYAGLSPDLEVGDTAVIVGQGNVALDVARVLLSGVDRLKNTDITGEALEKLSRSRIKRVRVIGRRGPMQAAFTIKEVRELLQLPHVQFDPIPSDLLPSKDFDLPRTPKRIAQLLSKHSTAPTNPVASSRFSLEFLFSPTAFGNRRDNELSHIEFVKNRWAEGSQSFDPKARSIATQSKINVPAAIAFRSIGYKSEPLPGMSELGIEFDNTAGIIVNRNGRVTSGEQPIQGLYCTGWVKSGPNGVIATTMEDAFATAEAIASDWGPKRSSRSGAAAFKSLLSGSVNWDGWQRIDAAERSRGSIVGKEREKFTSISEMLSVT